MIRLIHSLVALTVMHSTAAFAAKSDRGEELVAAARQGDTKKVKQLLAAGVDINYRGRFNITALWQASSKRHKELLRFLIEKGADVNVPDSIWHITPLMYEDDPDLAVLLIKHGARGVEGRLNRAALAGKVKLVRAILGARRLDPQSLARAKAHAEIRNRAKIVELIEKAAGKPLPKLPSIPNKTLAGYTGKYLSDRLNEIEVVTRKGRLIVKSEYRSEMPLVAVDQRTFAYLSARFHFEVRMGRVTSIVQRDLFSERRYVPRSVDLKELAAAPAAARKDDPRVLARGRWPSFRGIEARGLAAKQDLPDDWNVETGRNVRWRTPIAGLGLSCPIVWDDRVFVTTAISKAKKNDLKIGLYGDVAAVDDKSKHSWRLLCLDRRNGQVLWERTAHEGVPPVKRHLKSSQANSTPATDGQHVVALLNSGGLYCYDIDGRLLWKKQLGVLDSGAFSDPDLQWGFGSSPIIFRDLVIVQCDIQQGSFIAAYDLKTGSPIWKQPRDEVPSWGTPTVYDSPDGPLLFANGTNFARAYDALSGRERWRLSGNAAVTVPTPLVAYGLTFITSGYRPIQPIFAVRLDAKGDISISKDRPADPGIAWSKPRGGPYLPTPLVYRGYLYTCGNNGVLTCYEATTGRRVYRKRMSRGGASSFTASLVAADGRIYLTAESGDVLVVKAGPKCEVLGKNALGGYCLSTPAIAGGLFVARTKGHLVAIGRPAKAASAADSSRPVLVESRRIWDKAPHNAFTDLIRFKGRWYCVFREGRGHVSPDGSLRVITSADGRKWESAALISSPNSDLRDAKITVTPDGRLMLSGAEAINKPATHRHQSLVWFSSDGKRWSRRHEVADRDFWLWRITWHKGNAYGFGYRTGKGGKLIRFYSSRDGRKFDTLIKSAFDAGYPNETSLAFQPDGTCYCLLRRDGKANTAQLGVARPPFTRWAWKDLGVRIGGPHMIRLPDGRYFAVVRLYDGKTRTSLCRLDPIKGTLAETLKLPSGGDTSYAGLVWHDGRLWISYYSSHEGKTSIYLAQVRL